MKLGEVGVELGDGVYIEGNGDLKAVDAASLELLCNAGPAALGMADLEGNVPLHYLARSSPEDGDMWQILIKAAAATRRRPPGAAR